MALEDLKQALFSLAGIFQGLRLYPAEHPQIQRQLENTLKTLQLLLSQEGKLAIGLLDGTLLLNDVPCLDQLPALQQLSRLLDRQQLQAVEFLPGIDSRQLLFFCQELPQLTGGELPERLANAGATSIRASLMKEEPDSPQIVYQQALHVVEDVFNDVRLGHIPNSEKAVTAVHGMLATLLEEPYTLLSMAMLKDYDNYTFTHSVNVAVISLAIGQACRLSEAELHQLGLGGLLHDLGKMTIDHQIVNKPGKLNREEIEAMKKHPVNGARIVAEMEQMTGEVIDIVNGHHLRFDRTGYPADSRGISVTPLADMACIADTYDAMTTLRCYQRPRSPKQALVMMSELSGSHLHPDYLQSFFDFLGPFPVGTLVRLRDGSIGLICDQNRRQSGSLTLKIIFASDGSKLAEAELLELPDNSEIVAEVDPFLKGIQLEDYLPA